MLRQFCRIVLFICTVLPIAGETRISVPGSDLTIRLWSQKEADGALTPYYQIETNQGVRLSDHASGIKTSYELKLLYGDFDPMNRAPEIAKDLQADSTNRLYIVQFVTQPLPEYRRLVRDLGGTVHFFLANHAHLVTMDEVQAAAVAALPVVRWVGPYHPAYRLEAFLRTNLNNRSVLGDASPYNIMLFQSELAHKEALAQRFESIGAAVNKAHAGKYLMEVSLNGDQLKEVMRWNEILFIDRWSPMERDMNNAREYGGANFIETVEGFTGQGVRGEVFDAGFNLTHVDFASNPLIQHTPNVPSDSHGAATSGIVFGDGTGNANARGLLPDGQGIVAFYDGIMEGNRYDFTAELLQDPYYAVFQTSSVGSARTANYTTLSADMDAMLFDLDIVHCQSQSNAGDQQSRPQAWAKNIISGGAVNHQDTLDPSDDCWCSGASIGPATDGRIKPDLCAYYDATLTTTTGSNTSYTTSFGGTSGATPIIAGHVGLFFQMWSEGIFGNTVTPGASVFDNRCHMTTAKAMLINTARPYEFTGTSHDLTRVHQGWGFPDLRKLYEMREQFVIVDETDLLSNLETASYDVAVQEGQAEFRATLVYADPAGVPASSQHRINDLTLKVTSPGGTVYWGNNGLLEGVWSTPGGDPNHIDTVENVFIQNPEGGLWQVQVLAEEINQDGHVETPNLDADFALVISGAELGGFFLLNADRTYFEACSGQNAEITLTSVPLEGYNTDVAMSVENLPAGLQAQFSNTTLSNPGQVTLTLSGFANLTPGVHQFQILGTSPDIVRTISMTFHTSVASPNPVAAVYPLHQATEVELRPILSWSPRETATSYLVQLATDPEFNQLVLEREQTGTELSVNQRLESLTQHYWRVLASNGCGDQGYATFTFTTLDQPDYFTEAFTTPFDIQRTSITFTPDGSGNFYEGCAEAITELPTDPASGTTVTLADDANFELVLSTNVSFYGTSYDRIFIGSNGYATFNTSDTGYSGSLSAHFDRPRISGCFRDMNPSSSGRVSYEELADRLVITYENVPQYNQSDANTFQFELFYDGILRLSWMDINATTALTGLSRGQNLPTDFLASDLSALDCSCEAIAIATHPESHHACLGETLEMTVTVTGEGPTYQWMKDGSPLNGATSDTLIMTDIGHDDAGEYECEVTGTCGNATTQKAMVTVGEALDPLAPHYPTWIIQEPCADEDADGLISVLDFILIIPAG